jgi:methyltransferase (TIGR00027 family)
MRAEDITGHLASHYGIEAAGLTELDRDVFRVDPQDGPSLVARVFPASRRLPEIEGDAAILHFLGLHEFPSERWIPTHPVTVLDERGVLVTQFATGRKPRPSGPTFHRLGTLLGRLHALPVSGAAARDGGAWHHLASGRPRAEVDAALALADEAAGRLTGRQRPHYQALRAEIERIDAGDGLPDALIHPDFVPANAIASARGDMVIVDWACAGRGPRLWSLAFLLWAAGASDLALVDSVLDGYRTQVELETDELARLGGMIGARPVIFECWRLGHGHKDLAAIAAGLPATRDLAAAITSQAIHAARNTPTTQTATRSDSSSPLAGLSGPALAIAAIRAQESVQPGRLFDDPLAAAFVAASGWTPPAGPPDRRSVLLRFWVIARTVFMDELLAAAVRDGCRQVVLLGAGLDTRAFRLPWPPGVRCFELADADLLEGKELVLAAQAAQPGCERIPVPCDFRTDWPGELLAAGFTAEQPAVWIAEGLMTYLPAAEADEVLADLSALSASGSRLGVTLSGVGGGAGGQGRAPRAAARRRSTAPENPRGWLAGFGWTAELTTARDVLVAHARVPAGRRQASPGQGAQARGLLIEAVRGEPSPPPASADRGQHRPVSQPQPATPATGPQLKTPARQPRSPAPAGSASAFPLSALLSQALVAFTIEYDNEFEHRMPHATTNHGRTAGARHTPWLVSRVMWATCMRYVGDDWLSLPRLEELAGTSTNLAGMQRWRYIEVHPDPAARPKPPRTSLKVRATPAGLQARQVWQPLDAEIEQRWADRFGAAAVDQLGQALRAVESQLRVRLPGCLPILGYPMTTAPPDRVWPPRGDQGAAQPDGTPSDDAGGQDHPSLATLLSRVLIAFAIDYESQASIPLAVAANTLRVLDETGVRLRELPAAAGVSKEATTMALGHLTKKRLAVEEPDPAASRGKIARLTPAGRQAQQDYHRRLAAIEETWAERFGADVTARLRTALTGLTAATANPGQPAERGGLSHLLAGLRTYPDGWRATARGPQTLPHFPMVLHRGGYPDGS